jgi:hypothetical protein
LRRRARKKILGRGFGGGGFAEDAKAFGGWHVVCPQQSMGKENHMATRERNGRGLTPCTRGEDDINIATAAGRRPRQRLPAEMRKEDGLVSLHGTREHHEGEVDGGERRGQSCWLGRVAMKATLSSKGALHQPAAL